MKLYWTVEAMYPPFSRRCRSLCLTAAEAEKKPRFVKFSWAGFLVYRESFARKSRAMKRVDHIYAKNPQLDD
jgi:hypothetical protein